MNILCRIHCNEVILRHFCFGCCWFGYLSLFLLWRHVIQYLCAARAAQRVMAGIWHWHSCINQRGTFWLWEGVTLSSASPEKNSISLWAVSWAGQSTMPFESNLMRNPQSTIPYPPLADWFKYGKPGSLSLGRRAWQIFWKLGKLLAYGGLHVWGANPQ